MALKGFRKRDIAAFCDQTPQILGAVFGAEGKKTGGGADANAVEVDFVVVKLIMCKLCPGQNVAAFLNTDGVVGSVAFSMATGIHNQHIKAGFFIGRCEVIGIDQAFTAAGENDYTAVCTKIKVLSEKLQTIVFNLQLGDAIPVLFHPGNAVVPHLHLLCVVREGADSAPFFRRGAHQLILIYFLGNGVSIYKHKYQTAQQQNSQDNQDFYNAHKCLHSRLY